MGNRARACWILCRTEHVRARNTSRANRGSMRVRLYQLDTQGEQVGLLWMLRHGSSLRTGRSSGIKEARGQLPSTASSLASAANLRKRSSTCDPRLIQACDREHQPYLVVLMSWSEQEQPISNVPGCHGATSLPTEATCLSPEERRIARKEPGAVLFAAARRGDFINNVERYCSGCGRVPRAQALPEVMKRVEGCGKAGEQSARLARMRNPIASQIARDNYLAIPRFVRRRVTPIAFPVQTCATIRSSQRHASTSGP